MERTKCLAQSSGRPAAREKNDLRLDDDLMSWYRWYRAEKTVPATDDDPVSVLRPGMLHAVTFRCGGRADPRAASYVESFFGTGSKTTALGIDERSSRSDRTGEPEMVWGASVAVDAGIDGVFLQFGHAFAENVSQRWRIENGD